MSSRTVFYGRALTAVEHVHADLLIGRRSVNHLIPDQPVFRLPQRVHVMNDKRLKDTQRQNAWFSQLCLYVVLLLSRAGYRACVGLPRQDVARFLLGHVQILQVGVVDPFGERFQI